MATVTVQFVDDLDVDAGSGGANSNCRDAQSQTQSVGYGDVVVHPNRRWPWMGMVQYRTGLTYCHSCGRAKPLDPEGTAPMGAAAKFAEHMSAPPIHVQVRIFTSGRGRHPSGFVNIVYIENQIGGS